MSTLERDYANVVEAFVADVWCELAPACAGPVTVDQALNMAWYPIAHPVHGEMLVQPRSFPLRHVVVAPDGERIPQGSSRSVLGPVDGRPMS